jgi:Flp pilus assembly CpaE family ATPase
MGHDAVEEWMYPLKVILVGCNEQVLPQVRQALHDNPAVTEAEFPRVNDAIDNYRWAQDETRLLILYVRGIQEVDDLQRLKRTFASWPILALIDFSRSGSSNLLLLANRAGASQVVPLPLELDDFRAALDAIGKDYGYAAANAKVVAVSGVTGGCGATSLTINLAYEMMYLDKVCSIAAELACQRGMLATYLNVEPQYVISDLLTADAKLDMHMVEKALTRVADNFHILSGAHHTITPMDVQARDVHRLLDYLRRLAQVLVLDVPCTNDELFLQTLNAADQIVLVSEPNPPALRALHLVLELLGRGDGMPEDATVHVVLNRYDARNTDLELKKIQELLRLPRVHTVANDYTAVRGALNSGVVLRAKAPRSRALADVDKLARLIYGGIEPPTGVGARLLGSLAKVFGG